MAGFNSHPDGVRELRQAGVKPPGVGPQSRGELQEHRPEPVAQPSRVPQQPLYRLGQHRFAVGEYVSVTDDEGRLLTYKVTEVQGA